MSLPIFKIRSKKNAHKSLKNMILFEILTFVSRYYNKLFVKKKFFMAYFKLKVIKRWSNALFSSFTANSTFVVYVTF